MKNTFTQESLSIKIDPEMLKNWKTNESTTSFLNVFNPKSSEQQCSHSCPNCNCSKNK